MARINSQAERSSETDRSLRPTSSPLTSSGMFFLVTGASGVGKTTVRKLIEAEFAEQVVSCELATLGITPEWSLRWRHMAVEQVVQRAVKEQKSGKHFLLCGDPVPPCELYVVPSAAMLEGIEVCLLDVSPEKQTERLTLRGDPPDFDSASCCVR